MPEQTEKEILERVFQAMYAAFGELKGEEVVKNTRVYNSMDRLQEAMMWLNKDRASKGYFEKKLDTHVEE